MIIRPRPVVATLLFLVLAAPAAAAGSWEEAMTAYQEQRWDDAIAGFEAGLEADPDEPRWHYMLGLSLLSAGRPGAAAARLERALELAGGAAAYALPLARAQLEAGDPERALATLGRHRPQKGDGGMVDKWVVLVGEAADAADPAAGGPLLREAVALRPASADLHLALGRAHSVAGDPSAAFEAYARAFELAGGTEAGLRAIGSAFTAAEAAGDGVTGEDAEDAWYRRAAEVAGRLSVEGAPPRTLLLAGDALLLGGRPAEAERRFEAAVAADPESAAARYQLARSRLALDDPGAALERLAEALERAPDPALERRVQAARGRALHELERYEAAAEAYRRAGDERRAALEEEAAAAAEHNAQVERESAECREEWARIDRLRAENRHLEDTAVWEEIDRQAARLEARCGPPPEETAAR